MQFKDSLQRNIIIEKLPQRIICLVPSLTELLFDLGLEKKIVGITKYCIHPFHFQSTKTIVGETKKINYSIIENLNPDFILCNKEENTKAMVTKLEKIAPVYVSEVNNLNDSLDLILQLGIILGKRTEAQLLVEKIQFKHRDFLNFIVGKRTLKVIYFIWKDPWMVAGSPTFINDLLRINRMENVFASAGRYPKISVNHLKLQGNPELLLFSSEPYSFTENDVYEVLTLNEKVLTIFVDGQYFSWYGSRLLKAFDYFKKLQEKILVYEL